MWEKKPRRQKLVTSKTTTVTVRWTKVWQAAHNKLAKKESNALVIPKQWDVLSRRMVKASRVFVVEAFVVLGCKSAVKESGGVASNWCCQATKVAAMVSIITAMVAWMRDALVKREKSRLALLRRKRRKWESAK